MSVETLVEAADAAQVAMAALVDALPDDLAPELATAIEGMMTASEAVLSEAYTLGEEAGILEADDDDADEMTSDDMED